MFYNFANTSIALSIHCLHSKAKKAFSEISRSTNGRRPRLTHPF